MSHCRYIDTLHVYSLYYSISPCRKKLHSFSFNSRGRNYSSHKDRLPSSFAHRQSAAKNKLNKKIMDEQKEIEDAPLLELMCGWLVFLFQELTLVKWKLTNAKQLANTTGQQSPTLQETHQT